jgi:hypothetical protein
LIEQAKKLAAGEGTCVSAIFSRLLRAMTRSRSSVDTTGPLTEKATGLIRLPARAADDAIQFYSAIHAAARCLITRDVDHFPETVLPVLSPAEYLASLAPE